MKKLAKLITGMMVVVIGIYLFLVWQNNKEATYPSEAEIRTSFEKSIGWLQANRTEILASTNSMLWWMIKESADLTNDPRLVEIYVKYKENILDKHPRNVWRPIFFSNSYANIDLLDIIHFPDYNLHFIYGASCSRSLEKEEVIQRQLKPNFCDDHHPISPACVTHQMMGMRFMQRHDCGDQIMVKEVIAALQDKIETQLVWDPRIVDVYLQRVMMLLDSGAEELVKPIWIKSVLDAQLNDGGWGGSETLFPVGSNKYLSFTSHIFGIRKEESDFHASAQGLLIMSMLLAK